MFSFSVNDASFYLCKVLTVLAATLVYNLRLEIPIKPVLVGAGKKS